MRANRFRGWLAALLVPTLLGIAVLAGCGRNKLNPVGNRAPVVSVFVSFPDTTDSAFVGQHATNHLVHLYWYGSDPDGFVKGFAYRFVYPRQAAPKFDTTTALDMLFSVYTPDGVSTPVFEIYAFDNQGAVSDTARQRFAFTNQPPTLTLTMAPRTNDTTYASLTLGWVATDPDGNSANMKFRVWLAGDSTRAVLASQSPYTLPSALFYRDSLATTSRETVFVQPIDDGGMLGNRASATWIVRRPVTGTRGRLLMLDDLPSATSLPVRGFYDALYINAANAVLPGQYDVLRTEFTQPFRSAEDLRQTLRQFGAVVWYRGPATTSTMVSPLLRDYQSAIADYIASGGRFYIESPSLVDGRRASGALSMDFASSYLGADQLYLGPIQGETDSTASWGANAGTAFDSQMFQDSLRVYSGFIFLSMRSFAVRDTHNVVIWARAGALSPPNPMDAPVAVTDSLSNHGRCVAVTFPLLGANVTGGAPRILDRILRTLLRP